ncbi:MAG: nucleotidyltransferase family protein [Eubacteriales bacterium]|nr:nucleotidyltransferase family protein [Eubacteriales bacterium]
MKKDKNDRKAKKILRVSAILLAAGDSTRFGIENKLLWDYDGRPMYQYAMETLVQWRQQEEQGEAICIKDVICVSQYETLLNEAAKRGIKPVENKKSGLGISHSIQLGIEQCTDTDAFLFFVCDQPNLRSETLKGMGQMAAAVSEKNKKWIVCAGKKGKPRNPAIFSASLREELQKLSGDTGGKQIIKRYPQYVFVCEAAEKQELIDFDRKSSFLNH